MSIFLFVLVFEPELLWNTYPGLRSQVPGLTFKEITGLDITMALSKCCISGFNWDGKPTGKETKLAGLNTYVSGSNKDAAVLIIHDIFGWTFTNARLLADHYANEAGVTVYIPDL